MSTSPINPNKQLTSDDIQMYRNKIAKKHGFYDPKQHAHFLATYIHQHLDHMLEEFSLDSLDDFKRTLIKNTLAKGSIEIKAYDLYLELSRQEASLKEDSVLNSSKWHWLMVLLIFFIFTWGIVRAPFVHVANDAHDVYIEEIRIEWFPTEQANPFPYAPFDLWSLRDYIALQRNGLVGSPEYFYTIVFLAKENDLDPLLLLAIIGQEQSFVPTNHPLAHEIINNPFNVFHSWLDFNTTLAHSTQIAINTVKNRLSKAPPDVDVFEWLNGTYAEDPDWHLGVRIFYRHMSQLARPDSID